MLRYFLYFPPFHTIIRYIEKSTAYFPPWHLWYFSFDSIVYIFRYCWSFSQFDIVTLFFVTFMTLSALTLLPLLPFSPSNPSLRYTSMLLGHEASNQQTNSPFNCITLKHWLRFSLFGVIMLWVQCEPKEETYHTSQSIFLIKTAIGWQHNCVKRKTNCKWFVYSW